MAYKSKTAPKKPSGKNKPKPRPNKPSTKKVKRKTATKTPGIPGKRVPWDASKTPRRKA